MDFEYKYVLCDPSDHHIIKWEEGGNRKINIVLPEETGVHFIKNDEQFTFKFNFNYLNHVKTFVCTAWLTLQGSLIFLVCSLASYAELNIFNIYPLFS